MPAAKPRFKKITIKREKKPRFAKIKEGVLHTTLAQSTPSHIHPLKKHGRNLLVASILLGLLIGSTPLLTWALDSLYSEKILPGVTIGDTPISGLTREQVHSVLEDYEQYLEEEGMLFKVGNRSAAISLDTLAMNPDISRELLPSFISFEPDVTFDQAYAIGRSGTLQENLLTRIGLFFKKNSIAPIFTLDEQALQTALQKEFGSEETEYYDAHFTFNEQTQDLDVVSEKAGIALDYTKAIQETKNYIANVEQATVVLEPVYKKPSITVGDISFVRDQIYSLLARPLVFVSGENNITPKKQEVLQWIAVQKENTSLPRITINTQAVQDYLKKAVAPLVSVVPQAAKYELHSGKITTFQMPHDGQELDIEETIKKIENALFHENPIQNLELPLKIVPAPISKLGDTQLILKEIIGKAETNFAGSPTNRRHNIRIGVEKINGIIVGKGEVFSLVQTLGAIDEQGGFKPELVIKGNKTTPEFGGGLCQVSTTLFRAVSYSGLPVVERRNHSYRVAYYEPPVGFDATIYFPKPDFRFQNDTAYPILIQARVVGTKVQMELWGVGDGRKVEVDEPTVFNIKKAGEIKYIETTDLPPGKKKCTERAHNGADAIFERRVTYPSGEMKKDTFKSHYVVWPAVCLIGKNPEEKKGEDASSTASTLEQTQQTSIPLSNGTTSSTTE